MNNRDTNLDSSAEILSDIGEALASSLQTEVMITLVAQRLVPRLGDLCVIDLIAPEGAIREVAVAALDEVSALQLEEIRERHPIDPAGPHPVARAIRSGGPLALDRFTEQDCQAVAQSDEHLSFIRAMRYSSAYVVPLRSASETLGTISLLTIGERSPLDASARVVVHDVARTLALAIEKARLFAQVRRTERFLQAVLAGLTEAVAVLDPDGRIVFANQAAADLLDFASPGELCGAPPEAIDQRVEFYDTDGARVALEDMPCGRLLRGEEVTPTLVRAVTRASLRECWARISVTPVTEEAAGFSGDRYLVSVIEDVTELVRAGALAGRSSPAA